MHLLENECLEDVRKVKRLYSADFPEMSKIGPYQIKHNPYEYQPSAIFAVPKKSSYNQILMPIAIKCGSDESYPWNSANREKTDSIT